MRSYYRYTTARLFAHDTVAPQKEQWYIYRMNPESFSYKAEKQLIDIEDPEEAKQFIRERMEDAGEMPTVTVPIEYAEAARQGIKPHTTWIFDAIIAGTLGRDPYQPNNLPRATFRIRARVEDVIPRFTGPDRHFHGVVIFKGTIPPELIEEVN